MSQTIFLGLAIVLDLETEGTHGSLEPISASPLAYQP
jgi:hypothetical protein